MAIDVLDFIALADKSKGLPFSRQTHSLGGNFDIVTPIDPASGYGQWRHVKGFNITVAGKQTNWGGFPWDIKLYDENYIYDWVTEDTWEAGPHAFKKFVANHPIGGPTGKKFADGMIQFPRYVDSENAGFDIPIPPSQTSYATFMNCKQVGAAESLGLVRQRFRGPFLLDHGGDVGPMPTLIQQYYWVNSKNGVSTPTLEENYYALHYGWVSWKLQAMDSSTGLYKFLQTTLNNKLAEVKAVPFNFPCF